MDLLHNLYLGFSVAFDPANLLFCFIGCFLGTLVGVLPGIGPGASIALLLPLTYAMRPETSIIMLAGIYYGCQYGGSITSILVNIPGEVSSVVTCIDGYQMARKGKAGPALGISAFGSFIGGTVSIIGLMMLGPLLARFALKFGSPEYFALTFLSLIILNFLSRGSVVKCYLAALFGLFVGLVGSDPIFGIQRFTYGSNTLADGIGIVPAVMGLFGVAEVLINLESKELRMVLTEKIKNLYPSLEDWKESIGAILRGTGVGFFLGLLPGIGPLMASFTSYAIERRASSQPELFGTGHIPGVAGPETANNAASTSNLVPLLSLGLPSNVIMAMLLVALMIHGITPTPLLVREHPQIFWGFVASMYIGNIFLLVLNLPLIPMWVKLLKVRYEILFPMILLFCLIGVYTINTNPYEILIMLAFGAIGYLMRKTGFEAAPFAFAMVIGPMMETNLRQALLQSRGDLSILFTRPISAVVMAAACFLLILQLFPKIKKKRVEIQEMEND
jgi:putative tricarboxylic transport membrane protein